MHQTGSSHPLVPLGLQFQLKYYFLAVFEYLAQMKKYWAPQYGINAHRRMSSILDFVTLGRQSHLVTVANLFRC